MSIGPSVVALDSDSLHDVEEKPMGPAVRVEKVVGVYEVVGLEEALAGLAAESADTVGEGIEDGGLSVEVLGSRLEE